jgi:3-methyladenine DNA glycosylase AlkD
VEGHPETTTSLVDLERRSHGPYYCSTEMKQSPEIVRLANEISSRLELLSARSTAEVRATRREFSHQIRSAASESVIQLALHLLDEDSDLLRFFSYELISHHKLAFEQLTKDDLLKLGKGLNSWSSVDCFAMYLSGPMWANGRLSDKTIATWAHSQDRWWRRTALVSTVALGRRGGPDDLGRVAQICALHTTDRDDMVVKALSWALREVAKKHPKEVRAFLTEHSHALAARVIREVNNKLKTGLKTPRSSARKA